MPEPIYRIVLTGGPCGGKTSALATISQRLKALDFDVYCVPEAATLVFAAGTQRDKLTPEIKAVLQTQILNLILAMEDAFEAIARAAGRPAIILCDRGTMDAAAYLPPDAWTAILDARNATPEALRDQRYHAVIHLVTAAVGAEHGYSLANNATRNESPEQARELDHRIRHAWTGHPEHHVIDNSTGFNEKLERAVAAVCKVVNAPAGMNIVDFFQRSPIRGVDLQLSRDKSPARKT